ESLQRRILWLWGLRGRPFIASGERLNRLHDAMFGLVRDISAEDSPMNRLLQQQRLELVGGARDRTQPQRAVARGARPLGPHKLRAAPTP
ncbi:hypothetical protein, partial [Luteibacter rhizovicinus]|uniref:hypothetical protein n=1 Tax=Luteibacter rhizovicinus TaxID=242606 RepID=UPI00062D4A0C